MCSYTRVQFLVFLKNFLYQYIYQTVKNNKNGYKKQLLILFFILVNEYCIDTEVIVNIKIWLICFFLIPDSYCLECC